MGGGRPNASAVTEPGTPIEVEYVTDPVPFFVRLRCPACNGHVRQMREELSARQHILMFLCGEPLGWIVFAVGSAVGYVMLALAGLILAWLVIGPILLAWLYVTRLRNSEFLCRACGRRSSYLEARRQALAPARVSQR
jgi:hypothetical protein